MYLRKSLAFIIISLLSIVCIVFTTFADSISHTFTAQSATGSGSSNSLISVDAELSYVNKGDNSSIIGNYFEGHYYDSVLGYFKTDWSSNTSENMRIVGSTGVCPVGYGYKLGGYAYSEYFGYIDFDYDADTFVYYCVEDETLYGNAYNSFTGFQNFEGITFDIQVEATIEESVEPSGTGAFVNDTTQVTQEENSDGSSENNEAQAENSNFTNESIQNNLFEFDSKYESLFYIIK